MKKSTYCKSCKNCWNPTLLNKTEIKVEVGKIQLKQLFNGFFSSTGAFKMKLRVNHLFKLLFHLIDEDVNTIIPFATVFPVL